MVNIVERKKIKEEHDSTSKFQKCFFFILFETEKLIQNEHTIVSFKKLFRI